jgi:hypothetical protein
MTQRIARLDSKAARWIAADAIRELGGEAFSELDGMNIRLAISLAILFATVGCPHRASVPPAVQPATPVNLTSAADSELQKHLGERVTMQGQFSLRGKVGPFILVGGRPIYLVPKGTFSWGEPYAKMEGQNVHVTGTLRFAHYPVSPPEALPEGRPADHFYFEAETTKVELSQK